MSAPVQQCPVCNRVLYFSHGETNLLRCDCGQTVLYNGDTVSARAFYTVLQPADFIQPGTEGQWEGKSFRVLGRIRAWFDEAVFNYWTIAWPDGSLGYLGEGYGLYAIYERVFVDRDLTASLLEGVKVGARRDLFKGEAFVLERKARCHRWELEGEAWLPLAPASFRSFEFADTAGRRVEAIELDRNIVHTFWVNYTSQESLHLKNTRKVSWPAKAVDCDHCKKENTLKAYPLSQSYACVHCGTRHVLNESTNFKPLANRNATDPVPNLALGSAAVFDGVNYELIGYAQKRELNKDAAQWKEYTLFNAQHGFLTLSEYNGHWIKVRERGDAPVLERDTVMSFTFTGERFELYNRYNYDLVHAAGEFPYNAFDDGENEAAEFISPPEVWIREKSGAEGMDWFLGTHLKQSEVKTAFGGAVELPWKTGVGAVEPRGYVSLDKIVKMGFGAVLLLAFVHLLTSFSHRSRIVLDESFSFSDTADTATFVRSNLQLDKSRSNLELKIFADVDNSWAEVGATLVDAVKGTEYSAEQGVEYYHGYSDGESWTEGSRGETMYLNEIPAGRYNLIIRGLRERKVSYFAGQPALAEAPNLQSFSVKAIYDTTNDRNLFFCLIPVVLWPLVHFLLVRYNERQRWYNSPFSPYTYND